MAQATSPKAYAVKELTPIGGKRLDTMAELKELDAVTMDSLIADARHEMTVLGVPIKES